ncbi:hypothetical protein AR158_c506R [Paramecium bursaria Chlorella virus AR158]|uniref:hypothetical protein n=1 Tax=Paramecium bursaria Chlorella virus AR158 TaxID=380598 RepID=UPI00015AA728|nr:hypothetical protein AR158_c506R [Paramecium bursaria Chlorella virus AR158]ABU44051.1 hypothetical protein AR158_c506R [Paramecium bursaria Chlorella virus AR158]
MTLSVYTFPNGVFSSSRYLTHSFVVFSYSFFTMMNEDFNTSGCVLFADCSFLSFHKMFMRELSERFLFR